MEHNPYSPPSAPVADRPSPELPLAVPNAVKRACVLLWVNFAIGLLGTTLNAMRLPIGAFIFAESFGAVIGFLIALWFTSKLKRGRNWMRLLLTILTLLGLLLMPLMWRFWPQAFEATYHDRTDQILLVVVESIINLIAVFLINMPPARTWFRAMKERASPGA